MRGRHIRRTLDRAGRPLLVCHLASVVSAPRAACMPGVRDPGVRGSGVADPLSSGRRTPYTCPCSSRPGTRVPRRLHARPPGRWATPKASLTPTPFLAGPWRVTRAWAMSCLVVWVSALGHAAGGGSLPGWPVLVVASLLAFPPAAFLTSRRLKTAAATAYLGLGQIVLHVGFAATATSFGGQPGVVVNGADGHCAPQVSIVPTAPSVGAHSLLDHGLDIRMTVAHLVSAAVLGRIVARADTVAWLIWHLLSTLAAWLRPNVTVAPLVARPRRLSAEALLPRPRAVLCVTLTPTRGPPVRAWTDSTFVSRFGVVTT